MNFPGGQDEHSGAGKGTGFTVNGAANLTRGAWTLIGTQNYEISNDHGITWNPILGPFTITRTMQALPSNKYQLTIQKTGPGINLTAGATPIYDVPTNEAINNVGGAAPDQTVGWNATNASIQGTGTGLQYVPLPPTYNYVVGGHAIQIDYQKTHPTVVSPAMNVYVLTDKYRDRVLAKARDSITNIINRANNLPPHIIVTLMQGHNGLPAAQQAFHTGADYRILLRVDKLMDTTKHMAGSVSGQYSQSFFTKIGKKKRYAEAAMTHETGHMLHAFTSQDKYKISTMSMMNYNPNPADPLDSQKRQISKVNTDVMIALAARNYGGEWAYASNAMQANPSEVVAEVFTKLMNGQHNIRRGLAAVYLAYGGMRSPSIDALLMQIFGHMPNYTKPEQTIPVIEND